MSLSSDIDGSENLLGLTVGDLQEDVTVTGNTVSGTLKYVTGYTGFSGDPAEQEGNYLAIVCTANEGDTITVQLTGGSHPDRVVTLDSDGILIARITNPAAQTLIYTATGADGTTETRVYKLSGLTLEEDDS